MFFQGQISNDATELSLLIQIYLIGGYLLYNIVVVLP